MRTIGLALGSGGARGLCEIGVLLWLKEQRIEVECLAGTSIGSIIGGAFAAGFTPQRMKEIALDIGWIEMIKNFRVSFSGKGLLDWGRLEKELRSDLGSKRIEKLHIPFACVATDLDTGREFIFREGDLVDAMSASACIPGVFPPVELMGRHFVDGELVNPVPLDLVAELGAERIVGVNSCRARSTERISHKEGDVGLVEKLDGWVRGKLENSPLLSSFDTEKWLDSISKDRHEKRKRKIIDIFTDSIAIVTSRVLASNEASAGPHFMISPPVGGYQDFDFDKAEEIVSAGYDEAGKVGEELMYFIENGERR